MREGDKEAKGRTGPALLLLAGRKLADGARVAVQAALHADEAKTAGPVLGWWGIRLVVVAAGHGQLLNERQQNATRLT